LASSKTDGSGRRSGRKDAGRIKMVPDEEKLWRSGKRVGNKVIMSKKTTREAEVIIIILAEG
jgi:hypothetical protein